MNLNRIIPLIPLKLKYLYLFILVLLVFIYKFIYLDRFSLFTVTQVSPASGQVIVSNSKIAIRFNQVVESQLIKTLIMKEEKIIIKSILFNQDINNPETLILELSNDTFPKGSTIKFQLEKEIRSLSAKTLSNPLDIEYKVADSLAVIETNISYEGNNLFLRPEVKIEFNKTLGKSLLYEELIYIQEYKTEKIITLSLLATQNNTMFFSPNQNLQCEELYKVVLEPEFYSEEFYLLTEKYTFDFLTKKCLQIVSTNIDNTGKNVPVNTHIDLELSELAKIKTLKSIVLTKEDGEDVSFSVKEVSGGKILRIIPEERLAMGKKYLLHVPTDSVTTQYGATLKEDFVLTFYTEHIPNDINLNVRTSHDVNRVLNELSLGSMTLEKIGISVSGENIMMGKFGKGSKIILIIGGHHGYEEISVGLPLYIMKALAREEIQIPENVAIWVIPVLNPDGFSQDRRTNANEVDLNRNYSHTKWGSTGTDRGIFYPGPYPFSEPETQAVKTLVDKTKPALVISYHSNLQYIEANSFGGMYPDLDALVKRMGEKTQYEIMNYNNLTIDDITASGDLTLWLSEAYNIPAITVELKNELWEKAWERNSPTLLLMIEWVLKKQ